MERTCVNVKKPLSFFVSQIIYLISEKFVGKDHWRRQSISVVDGGDDILVGPVPIRSLAE